MTQIGLTWRFMIWAVLTWALTGLAIAIAYTVADGFGGAWQWLVLYLFAPILGSASLLLLGVVSIVIWVLSWIVGRMRRQPDQVNAIISAMSVGMVNWLMQAFGVLYANGNPFAPGTVFEPTEAFAIGLGFAGIPVFLGPAVAAYLWRRR